VSSGLGPAGEAGAGRTIPSGHVHVDLVACDSYLAGSLQDEEHPQSAIEAALAGLPAVAESPRSCPRRP